MRKWQNMNSNSTNVVEGNVKEHRTEEGRRSSKWIIGVLLLVVNMVVAVVLGVTLSNHDNNAESSPQNSAPDDVSSPTLLSTAISPTFSPAISPSVSLARQQIDWILSVTVQDVPDVGPRLDLLVVIYSSHEYCCLPAWIDAVPLGFWFG